MNIKKLFVAAAAALTLAACGAAHQTHQAQLHQKLNKKTNT